MGFSPFVKDDHYPVRPRVENLLRLVGPVLKRPHPRDAELEEFIPTMKHGFFLQDAREGRNHIPREELLDSLRFDETLVDLYELRERLLCQLDVLLRHRPRSIPRQRRP